MSSLLKNESQKAIDAETLDKLARQMKNFSCVDVNLAVKDALLKHRKKSSLSSLLEKSIKRRKPSLTAALIELYNDFLRKFGENLEGQISTGYVNEEPKKSEFALFS